MPKNIVVFSDGTGKEGGEGNDTNVYKLFNMIEDRTPRQIAFYDRGLGTGWRRLTGSVGGAGISKNILECYRFIFDHFEAGDQIFLLGFSRGATTVRSLSGFIDLVGILPKSRPELISRAYRIYKIRDRARREATAAAFIQRHHNMWSRIRFLGVWDTVAALGLPIRALSVLLDEIPLFRHRFHDLRLSRSVENAYHALAIDDERLTFHPKLLDPEVLPYQRVRQVWFCGMHTDVGGGYPETGLSDIPLAWLRARAVERGLHVYPRHTVTVHEDADGFMHDSRGSALSRLYRRRARSWDRARRGNPVVHASVVQRRRGRDNQTDPPYAPWILQGAHDLEPWDQA